MSTAARTAIVIPAFNEEEALPAVLRVLAAEVPELDVIVVDDGSSDATAEVAEAAGVVCLRLPFNLGIGGALRAGFRYAAEHGYDRVVQFDADGQHDATQIATLLAELDRGADMVIGSRFARGEAGYRVGATRRLAMRLLRWSTRRLSGRRFTDTSSGFRAIGPELLEEFARAYPVEYMDSVETLVTASRAGFDVREVPVKMQARSGGEPSTRNVRLVYHYARIFVVLAGASQRRRRHRPQSDRRPPATENAPGTADTTAPVET